MKAKVWLRLHKKLHHQLWYKETGPNTIIYGIKWKWEEPLQVKDMNEPNLEQKTKVLYKQFRAYDNQKSSVILRWNESNWQLHILEGLAAKFKKLAPAGHIQMENSSI
jgi:hypothetical protein